MNIGLNVLILACNLSPDFRFNLRKQKIIVKHNMILEPEIKQDKKASKLNSAKLSPSFNFSWAEMVFNLDLPHPPNHPGKYENGQIQPNIENYN